MKENSLGVIRLSVQIALKGFQSSFQLPEEGHWEYKRNSTGSWNGALVPKPSYMAIFGRTSFLDELESKIEKALGQDYPEYLKAIGTPFGVGVLQPGMVLRGIIVELHKRFGTFLVTEGQIEDILKDVSDFFDNEKVAFTFYAPVINLHGTREIEPIEFFDEIILRPITDEEVTRFYGGSTIFRVGNMPVSFPNFVFTKKIEVPKIVGSFDIEENKIISSYQDSLSRCILALSAFKDGGAIGYDGIRIIPVRLVLGSAFGDTHHFSQESLPLSRYDISPEETSALKRYAQLFQEAHPTLQMATQRLVDAARRTKPEDTIVDSVIGLESVLLFSPGDTSELRFRFSLNYSALFPKEGRQEAFYLARQLYDLRSKIVHGDILKENVKIGGKEMSISEVAKLAKSILRTTIVKFLSSDGKPDFTKENYWLSKVLGIC